MYVDQNELYHYGVLGMKWGVRRAEKRGETYTYQSHGTKSYAKKAEKARQSGDSAKAKKYEGYHKRSVELDRKMQENAQRNSGKRVAAKMALVTGLGGSRTYEAVRAASGGSKYVSRGMAAVASLLSGPFGATPARALYVRGVDNNSVRNKALKVSIETGSRIADQYRNMKLDYERQSNDK